MPTVHCHLCGGFIANAAGTTYRAPDPSAPSAAVPHSALCACEHAVIYGIAPDAMPLQRIRSASRN